VEANPNIICMYMAKHSELVLSSLRNMILTKNKIKEEGMKCAVNSAKQTNKNKKEEECKG